MFLREKQKVSSASFCLEVKLLEYGFAFNVGNERETQRESVNGQKSGLGLKFPQPICHEQIFWFVRESTNQTHTHTDKQNL